MKTKAALLAIALSSAFAGSAFAMTKEEYKTEKTRVSADYKTAKQQCSTLQANAKDVCMKEAKGAEKVAKAEMESKYKPSANNTEKVGLAKGDATYEVAKQKCDDMSGDAKGVCVKDAKAMHDKSKVDAKASAAGMTKG